MAQVRQETAEDEYVYIELDRPSHWWNSVIGIIAIVLISGVLVAPWMINLDDETNGNVARNTLQSSSTVCRPNSTGLPTFLDPTVASWSRFCDWFIDPDVGAP